MGHFFNKYFCKTSKNSVVPSDEKEKKIDTKPSFHTEEELIGYLLIIDLLFEFLMIFWCPCVVAFFEIEVLEADFKESILAALTNIFIQFIPEVIFTIAIFTAIDMHPERVKKEIEHLGPWFMISCLCAFGGAVALSVYGIVGNMMRDDI